MRTPYSIGYTFENNLVRYLISLNKYDIVMRSAGSHTPVDILAMSENEIVLYQCKVTKDSSLEKIIKENNVKLLTLLPEKYIKVIVIMLSNGRKSTVLFYTFNNKEGTWVLTETLNQSLRSNFNSSRSLELNNLKLKDNKEDKQNANSRTKKTGNKKSKTTDNHIKDVAG